MLLSHSYFGPASLSTSWSIEKWHVSVIVAVGWPGKIVFNQYTCQSVHIPVSHWNVQLLCKPTANWSPESCSFEFSFSGMVIKEILPEMWCSRFDWITYSAARTEPLTGGQIKEMARLVHSQCTAVALLLELHTPLLSDRAWSKPAGGWQVWTAASVMAVTCDCHLRWWKYISQER